MIGRAERAEWIKYWEGGEGIPSQQYFPLRQMLANICWIAVLVRFAPGFCRRFSNIFVFSLENILPTILLNAKMFELAFQQCKMYLGVILHDVKPRAQQMLMLSSPYCDIVTALKAVGAVKIFDVHLLFLRDKQSSFILVTEVFFS